MSPRAPSVPRGEALVLDGLDKRSRISQYTSHVVRHAYGGLPHGGVCNRNIQTKDVVRKRAAMEAEMLQRTGTDRIDKLCYVVVSNTYRDLPPGEVDVQIRLLPASEKRLALQGGINRFKLTGLMACDNGN